MNRRCSEKSVEASNGCHLQKDRRYSVSRYSIKYMHPIQDQHDDNIDVEVALETGERFFPSFFTLANVTRLIRESAPNGVGYLWAAQMIVVEQLSQDVVERCIEDLVQTGEIRYFAAFDT